MNKVLLTAAAATLLAAPAQAWNSRPRRVAVAHVSAPSHAAAGASAPTYYGTPPVAPSPASQPSAAGISLALTAAQTMYRGLNGGGHAGPTTTRGMYAGGGGHYVFHDSSFWGRRLDAPSATPADAPTGGSGNGVPSVLMPGQLIRTGGLGALVSQPDAAPSTFAVEAGNRIGYEDSKGYALTTAPGVFTGPKDTLPPPNPTSGGGSSGAGGNGITENNNVTNISHSGNGAGNTTGSGNSGGGTQNGN